MDIEASWLLDQVRADIRATSERQHRDARRQHTLKAASLKLNTGVSAEEVRDWLNRQGLMLRPVKKAVPYDQYGRA